MRISGFGIVLVVLVILGLTLAILASRSGGGGDDPDDDGRGPGGRGPQLPRPPDDGPALDEPDWWPEFERNFANYVAEGRNRSGRSPRSSLGSPTDAACAPLFAFARPGRSRR